MSVRFAARSSRLLLPAAGWWWVAVTACRLHKLLMGAKLLAAVGCPARLK